MKFLGIMSSPFSPDNLKEPVFRLMESHVSLSPPFNSLYIVSVIVGTSDIKWVKGRRKEKLTPVTFCILLRAQLEKRPKQTSNTFKNKHGFQLSSISIVQTATGNRASAPHLFWEWVGRWVSLAQISYMS